MVIEAMAIPENALVPKRAVSLLWYLPSFLIWQKERVRDCGGDVAAYDTFIVDVHNAIERALGVP